MITIDNYEEYMIMHADGELQPQEEEALHAFLLAHPQLQAEMDVYSSIRLTPDHSQVYEHKAALLKQEHKVVAFPRFKTYAAAAAIVALLGIGAVVALRDGGSSDATNNQLAVNSKAANTTITETHAISPETTAPEATIPAPGHSATTAPQLAAVVSTTKTTTTTNRTTITTTVKTAQPKENALAATTRATEQLTLIKTAELQKLPVHATAQQAPLMAANYVLPGAEMQQEENKSTWFDKLPLDEDKKKSINTMANAVANGCEKINTFRERVENKGISLRIEKKNLIVSF